MNAVGGTDMSLELHVSFTKVYVMHEPIATRFFEHLHIDVGCVLKAVSSDSMMSV